MLVWNFIIIIYGFVQPLSCAQLVHNCFGYTTSGVMASSAVFDVKYHNVWVTFNCTIFLSVLFVIHYCYVILYCRYRYSTVKELLLGTIENHGKNGKKNHGKLL